MSEDLSHCLNEHSVFKKLSERLKSKVSNKSLGLFTFRNDIVYVWSEWNKCVDSLDIKLVLKKGEDAECLSLVPKPSLYFDVENVFVNSTSTVMCIYGPSGISVSKLPDRWLLKDSSVEISSDCLAQKVFVCDHHLLRSVSWHPGSPTDTHLLMLTSDEVLRLYNTLNCNLIWEYHLTERTIRRNLPSKMSIGETPVDFDFGLSEERGSDIVWPVFVVWGNGDVFRVETGLEEFNGKVDGLLRYEPAADDNYGSDASSIVVMKTYPPVVVIATCGGLMHHCLLLSEDFDKALHVVETVELELGILNNSEREDDIISCPVRIEKDPNNLSRYYCFHDAGINSVSVPLVDSLTNFDGDTAAFKAGKIESHSDYLLCTGLTGEVSRSPTLGVAYIDATKMLVLLSNGKLFKVPLFNRCESPSNSLNICKETALKTPDDFKEIVESLLEENGISTFPLVKLPGEGVGPSDLFKIVTRATGSLRSVLKCHSEVMLKIQQKADSLSSHLDKQTESIENLDDKRSSLRSTAEQIAEKYEEINEKQLELVKRSEQLLLKFECDPSITLNENKMENLLTKAKSKLKQLECDIAAVQSFYSRLEQVDTKRNEDTEVHLGSKIQLLYKSVKHLNIEVADLKKRIIAAKETVKHCQFQST